MNWKRDVCEGNAMKRCEGALKKTDGTFEQCDASAEAGSDYCWECQKLENTKEAA